MFNDYFNTDIIGDFTYCNENAVRLW